MQSWKCVSNKLIGLEIEALMKEHEETLKNIARYEDILNNYDSMAEVIIEDLEHFKKEYARKLPHCCREWPGGCL